MSPGADTGGVSSAQAAAALRRLEERLERASQAAESLLAHALSGHASAADEGGAPDQPSSAEPRSAEPSPPPGSTRPATASGGGSTPPPAGWQAAAEPARQHSDLELLLTALTSLRDLIPPELQRRLAEAVRELLLAARALIDWYLERVNRSDPPAPDVHDIPIL